VGAITSLIDEVYSRLNTARGAGKKLEEVKNVYIGGRDLVEKPDLTPSILILLSSGETIWDEATRGGVHGYTNIDLKFGIKYPIQTTANAVDINLYYDSLQQTGIIYLIEKMLDVIMETTSQAASPTLAQNSRHKPDVRIGNIGKSDPQTLYCEVDITFATKSHAVNGFAT
jgi:hypothetical protein